MELEQWQQVLSVNLRSVFICLKHEIKQMQRQQAGAIVNVACGAGLIAVPNMAGYCASKHGVLGLSRIVHQLPEIARRDRVAFACS